MKQLMFVLCTIAASLAWAGGDGGGGEVKNGGDVVQMEFIHIAKELYIRLNLQLPEPLKGLDLNKYKTVLDDIQAKRISVKTSSESLDAGTGDFKDAINIRGDDSSIIINRGRWNAISEYRKKVALVAHEILVLSGQDDKNYEFSTYFLSDVQLSLLIQSNAEYAKDSNAEYLKAFECYQYLAIEFLRTQGFYDLKTIRDEDLRSLVPLGFSFYWSGGSSKVTELDYGFHLTHYKMRRMFLEGDCQQMHWFWGCLPGHSDQQLGEHLAGLTWALKIQIGSRESEYGDFRINADGKSMTRIEFLKIRSNNFSEQLMEKGIPAICNQVVFRTYKELEDFEKDRLAKQLPTWIE